MVVFSLCTMKRPLCVVVESCMKGWGKCRNVFYFRFSISDRTEKFTLVGLRENAANLLSTEGCQSKLIDWTLNCGSLTGKTC